MPLTKRYLLFALVACILSVAPGCGSSNSTAVLDGEVAKDPSLDENYFDQEKYDAAIKGPENP